MRGRLAGIITLEDPIEHRLDGVTQIQVDPKGEMNFARTLASILRQDPGVIMVGEIRDAATAEAVIRAALTGHLVLSTVHCASAAESVTRLLDLGVVPNLLNSCLKGALVPAPGAKSLSVMPGASGDRRISNRMSPMPGDGVQGPDRYRGVFVE